jgi:hypothetical protein
MLDGSRRKKLRSYTVEIDEWEDFVLGIVADTSNEARKIAYESGECDRPWIEIKAIWVKHADVTGIEKGVIPLMEGVKRGIYGWAETKCLNCGNDSRIFLQNDKSVMCMKCWEDRAII